jgi:hypothetical protein
MTTSTEKVTIGAGMVGLVIVICVSLVFAVLFGAAVLGHRAATRAGNEAAALQNLKTIAAIEAQYFVTHRAYGTFGQLKAEAGLSSKFHGNPAIAEGYVFTLSVAPNSSWYKITVDPQDASTGSRHFYFDSADQRIRVNLERQAGPKDPLELE